MKVEESLPESVKKIAVIYSYVKREYFPTEVQYITEKDAKHDAEIIADEVRKLGVETVLIPANKRIIHALREHKPDMVFNLTDSIKGLEYLSSTIPGILDMMNIPFSGTGLLGLAICYNKYLTKQLLQSAAIPVPNFQLIHHPSDVLQPTMRFPLMSKLNEIHGAVEIDDTAVSENERDLRTRISYLIKTYDQPVLVEEFISGKEITAYVLQGNVKKVYLAEKVFNKPDEKYVYATFDDQWGKGSGNEDAYHYVKYEDTLLKDYVKRAFEITDMLDYGKFDVRIDASGRYYFIDSNANPAFGPATLDCAMGLVIQKLYEVPFQFILSRIIRSTMGLSVGVANGGIGSAQVVA